MLLGGIQRDNSIFFYSQDSDITYRKDNCLFIINTHLLYLYLYTYQYMLILVEHVSNWIKTVTEHEEACKRGSKK